MTDEVRCEPAQPGEEVMLPNDPQIREAERRRRDGIPLDRDVAAGLFGLASEHGVKLETL
jgi:LDH2 family malate/lactate/ureidoglycolate dehydrogenase